MYGFRGGIENIADDLGPFGMRPEGGNGQLEKVDGGGFGDQYLVRTRANQLSDFSAQLGGRIQPALVPNADEAFPPFRFDGARQVLDRPFWQLSQRVAIEIDFEVGSGEVHGCFLSVGVVGPQYVLSTARTGLASKPASFRGNAISS